MSVQVYTNIADVPLDEYTTPDVVDRPDHEKDSLTTASFVAISNELLTLSAHVSYVIPFKRAIKLNTKGKDVVGAKRAIWSANGLSVPKGATQLFGPTAVKQLKLFQKREHLAQDGVLGQTTLKKLAPFFDAYAFSLYVGYPPGLSKRAQQQHAFLAYMLWGYNERARIVYVQSRPMFYLDDLYHLPIAEDCSSWYTKGCKAANIKDPNDLRYDGQGWTGTIAANGTRVASVKSAQVADACLYGPAPNYEHVAGYIGGGRVCSLGSTPGPLILDANYRDDLNAIRRFT